MNLPKKRMDQLVAYIMTNRIADVRSLLANNGIDTSNLSDSDVQIAFLKAIKDSASFRSDLSNYASTLVQTKTNFVSQPITASFINQPMLGYIDDDFDGFDDLTGEPIPAGGQVIPTTSTNTSSSSSSSGGGSFWSTLGGLANQQNLNALFQTGLNAVSTSLKNKANQQSEQNALQLEQIRLQQIQAQNQLQATKNSGGLSTGAWIGIGLGAAALVTVIIIATRKKAA